MFYFKPITGLIKTIDVLSSKNKTFTSDLKHALMQARAFYVTPARFSLLNLSSVPVCPPQHLQGINLRDAKSFPLKPVYMPKV